MVGHNPIGHSACEVEGFNMRRGNRILVSLPRSASEESAEEYLSSRVSVKSSTVEYLLMKMEE